jgi:hypothetical protein
LSRFWPGWRHWLRNPVAGHSGRPGRPGLAAAIRDLIQQMSQANFLWGARRIHGELASMDFFTVPTATFRVLFVFIVL